MVHFYRYISALTALLIAFSAYAVAVAPWVEPPPIPRANPVAAGPVTPPVSPETKNELAALFPPGHWALDNPKIVETEQCTLLIQDYKPVEGGNLELKPCVLIFRARSAATAPPTDGAAPAKRSRPIILEAPKAELAFDRPLDVSKASFGRVEKGTLAGEVTIYSPPTTPTSGDALLVKTRAVWLDRQSIRTSNDVEFQYGDSSGRGRILEIALRSGEDSGKEKTKSQLGPLQTVTLRHLDYLRLATAGRGVLGGALPPAKSAMPSPATAALPNSPIHFSSDNAPIELRCQGEFTFDCLAQVARFERQVEVKRLLPNVAPDTLRCDELMLVFGQPPERPVATASDDPLAGRLQKLVAIGTPAVLESPTSALRAAAAHMEYSLINRQVILKANTQRNVPQVTLVQNEQHFIAPELQYEMSANSRLGKLLATGPGELRMLQGQGADQQTITARWGKSLTIVPQDQFQAISLVQAARVTIDPMGRFDANEMHLWVQETAQLDSNGSPGASPKTSLAPHRLEAIGAVHVTSEQLDVDTNRLQAWFVNMPPATTDTAPQRLPPIGPPPIHEPVQRTAWDGTPQSVFPAGTGPQATIRDVKPPSLQRFHVGGEQIQLQAIIRGRTFELEDLFIDGKADILETRTPEPNSEPIFARGSHLELRHGSSPSATTVKIDGQPAETGGRGMTLAGRAIDLARGKNELRIDGFGEATMPVQKSGIGLQGPGSGNQQSFPPAGAAAGLSSSARPPARPGLQNAPQEKLHIVWHDGLIFDGLTARITGDVEMRTATQLARAPILEVTLKDRFDFQSMGATPGSPTSDSAPVQKPRPTLAAQPQLARVLLDGGMTGVYGKNDGFDEAGQLVSCEQMRVRWIAVDMLTNNMQAQGPGWVSSVRRGSVQGPGALGQQPVAAIQGPVGTPNADPAQLTSIHVAFEKEMVGDLIARKVEFRQQVETTYSPANDFANVIAADRISDLTERVVLMTSDVLTVTEFREPPSPWIEVQATGNTKVRGQKFDVDAPIVSYSGQKETIKIEGNGRASAKAWVRQAPGDKPTSLEGERFTYNLRTGDFTPDVVKSIHINLPPNMKFGLPALPGAALPGAALPGAALPGAAMPGAAMPKPRGR